jgi:hypothetical protein
MTRIVLFLAALLYAGGSIAGGPSVVPPSRYDHQPTEKVVIVSRTPAQIRQVCTLKAASPWPGGGVGACTLYTGKNNPCIVLWPKGTPRSGILWRHERAHCNGWPSNHPG